MADNSKPVVLLIYANTGPALDCLKPETDTIAAHLKASGLCDVRLVPAATLSDVITAINDTELRDRVAIVHYAGHANGQGIQLEGIDANTRGETAYMRGLAEVLKQQPHLRLLFINGCASREQVLELTQAGIPLVIATNRGIDDKAARDFAEYFYRTLGQQRSIIEAFQVAAGSLQAGAGTNVRGVYFGEFQKSADAQTNKWPWELHGPDADRRWSLRDPYYRGAGPRWDHTRSPFNPESPYLGLRYFAEEESSRFFGRDDFVQTLLTANESAPLLLVIGASGTGKSSVVRAGMIPHWKKQHRGTFRGRAFVFTPEDDPFEQLSTTLAAVDTFDRKQIRSVRETPSRTALRDAVKTFGQGEPWLFFVDQFEQIFTRTTDQKRRVDFLDAITDLAKSEHPNVCLVLAMRDDFFPQLRDYPELFPLTDKHCFRVAALGRAVLQEVIERPAAENGVTFQPGLVDNIVDAIDRQPGALPLLQYALDTLWKADDLSDRLLNESTYTELGGVTGSLGRRLQNLYDQQDDSNQDQFRWMMLKLVTYDESDTGCTVVSRLAPKSEFAGKQVPLLDQLIAQGLVVSSGTSTPSVQLGHEKIIEAWPAFTKWTQESREANTIRQQLSKAANEWGQLMARHENKKATRALWHGSHLEKALELRLRGDFQQLGGLNANDNRFLDASHSRSQRLIRGLQWAIGAATSAALLLAIGAWQLTNTNDALGVAIADAKNNLAKSEFSRGNVAFDAKSLDEALLMWAKSCNSTVDPAWRSSMLNLIGGWSDSLLHTWPHENKVQVHALSPDGTLLTASGRTVRLWDIQSGDPKISPIDHSEDVRYAWISHDSDRFIYGGSDVACLAKVAGGESIKIHDEDPIKDVSFSPDGNTLVLKSQGMTQKHSYGAFDPPGLPPLWYDNDWFSVRLFDGRTGVGRGETHKLRSESGRFYFAAEGRLLVTTEKNENGRAEIKLWDSASGLLAENFMDSDVLADVDFDGSGRWMVTAESNSAQVWNTQSGENLGDKFECNCEVISVRWNENGRLVAILERDENSAADKVWIWEFAEGSGKRSLVDFPEGQVDDIEFTFAGESELLTFRQRRANGVLVTMETDLNSGPPWIASESFATNTKLSNSLNKNPVLPFAAFTDSNVVRIQDLETGQTTGQEFIVQTVPDAMKWSEDGRILVTIANSEVRAWQLRIPVSVLKHDLDLTSAKFSHDGAYLVTTSNDAMDLALAEVNSSIYELPNPLASSAVQGQIRTWETEKALNPRTINGLSNVELDLNSDFVIGYSGGKSLSFWDRKSKISDHDKVFFSSDPERVWISPNGECLLAVTGSSAQLWGIDDVRPRGEPLAHAGKVQDARFSSNGSFLVTWTEQSIFLWNCQTGERQGKPISIDATLEQVSVSGDGRLLVISEPQNRVRLLDMLSRGGTTSMLTLKSRYEDATFTGGSPTLFFDGQAQGLKALDVRTGLLRGWTLRPESPSSWVGAVSPDGSSLVMWAGFDGNVGEVWRIPPPAIFDADHPQRLQRSIEVRSGKMLTASGEIVRLDLDSWNEKRRELRDMGGSCDAPTWDQFRDVTK